MRGAKERSHGDGSGIWREIIVQEEIGTKDGKDEREVAIWDICGGKETE